MKNRFLSLIAATAMFASCVSAQNRGIVVGTPGAQIPTPSLIVLPFNAIPSTTVGGTETTRDITVRNVGPVAWEITAVSIAGANSGDFSVDCAGCSELPGTPIEVNFGGGELAFTITFDPAAAGLRTARLVIEGNHGPDLNINLSATGLGGPAVQLSTSTVNCGSHPVDATTACSQVTITNGGDANLEFDTDDGAACVIGGTNASDFAVQDPSICDGVILPGQQRSVLVTFTPGDEGARSGTLTIKHNAVGDGVGDDNTHTIAYSGIGTTTGQGTLSSQVVTYSYYILHGPGLSRVNGGGTDGPWMTAAEFYLYGTDGARINRSTWTASASSSHPNTSPNLFKDDLGNTNWHSYFDANGPTQPPHWICLAAPSGTPVSTTAFGYLPLQSGTLNGMLLGWEFYGSNTSCTADRVLIKSGTFNYSGLPSPPPEFKETYSAPTSIAFGSQQVGTTSTARTLPVCNSGNGTLSISAITVAAPFNVSHELGELPQDLESNTCANLTVTFSPTQTGTFNSAVQVTHDGSNGPTTSYPVSGSGFQTTLQSITVSPSTHTIQVGGTVTYSATGNYGTSPQNITEQQNITNQCTWASSNNNVACMGTACDPDESANVAKGTGQGTVTISCTVTP